MQVFIAAEKIRIWLLTVFIRHDHGGKLCHTSITLTNVTLSPLQLCNIQDNQWAFTCESFAQRISALEQLNDRMRALEQKLVDTQPAADAPIQATPPYPRPAKNCCALSELVHGRLVYKFPNTSVCPLHQDISPHTYNRSCIISGRTM